MLKALEKSRLQAMNETVAASTRPLEHWFGKSSDLCSLSAPPREFLETLYDLLERVQPPTVDRIASEIKPYGRGAHVSIAHSMNPDYSLLLDVTDDEVVVSFGSEHEHFSRDDHDLGRVWPFDRGSFVATSLFFIEQLLTGRIRVEILRRPFQIKTRAYWLNDEGELELFLRGGTILPIVGWSRSPEVEQISFMTTPGP